MRKSLLALILVATSAFAADEPQKLTIAVEPLGDSDAGVVTRVIFRFAIGSDIQEGVSLVVTGCSRRSAIRSLRFRRCSPATWKSKPG